jgi:hypothetical protein
MSEKIIALLNEDEQARLFLKRFEEAAESEGMIGEEYAEARKTILMMAIANNPEAMSIMANEIYETINA